jgi:hypothetical protein
MGNRMSAFAIGEDGSLGDRSVWAEFGPDGRTQVICAAPNSDVEQLMGKGLGVLYEVTVEVPAA